MDLRAAYNAAMSSLRTAEYQTSVSSSNIANAGVEGYTAKQAPSQTTMSGGAATGVTAQNLSSDVDKGLVRSLMESTSTQAYHSTKSTYLESLLDEYGDPAHNQSLTHKLGDLQGAVSALAVSPESDVQKEEFVRLADGVGKELNALSASVQERRAQADEEIDQKVDQLNQGLANIDRLNGEIMSRAAKGESVADLEDRRRMELEGVSGLLDVSYFITGNNELHVYTRGGQPLVDSQSRTLDYSPAGKVTKETQYPGGFDGIVLGNRDITTSISGGEIGALLDVRDESLPSHQDELDKFAVTLIDSVNTAHNTGTPDLPQNAMTGSAARPATDPFTGTGTMRIALVDQAGTAASITDLDLSVYATHQDVSDALNAIPGISSSIDTAGRLAISSDDPNLGVSVGEMDSAVGPANQGVSAYFALNDLFVGNSADSIQVRRELKEQPSLLSSGQLSSSMGAVPGDQVLSNSDASTVYRLADALSQDYNFGKAGQIDAKTTDLSGYASDILSSLSQESAATQDAAKTHTFIAEDLKMELSNASGVNLDEETAKIAALEEHYSASAQVLSVVSEMFDSLLDAVSR